MYYVSLFQHCMSTGFSSELTQQITALTPCSQTGGQAFFNSFCVPRFPGVVSLMLFPWPQRAHARSCACSLALRHNLPPPTLPAAFLPAEEELGVGQQERGGTAVETGEGRG